MDGRRIALIAVVAALAAAAPANATHLGSGFPDCINTIPAVEAASYDLGRIRTEGYPDGVSIGGVDLRVVDEVSPNPVPDVFDPPGPPPVHQELHLAAAPVSLRFDGLDNTFLLGRPPVTEVAQSAFPLDLATKSHAGAQNLSMVFSGRVRIYEPEIYACESVIRDNTFSVVQLRKFALDGYATTLDDPLAAFGTATNISIAPGENSDG